MNKKNYRFIELPDCCYNCHHYQHDGYYSDDRLCFFNKKVGEDFGDEIFIDGICNHYVRGRPRH